MVAQSIKRQSEMKEMDVTDNGSDAGMPEEKYVSFATPLACVIIMQLCM
jgi:hypothetical protein